MTINPYAPVTNSQVLGLQVCTIISTHFGFPGTLLSLQSLLENLYVATKSLLMLTQTECLDILTSLTLNTWCMPRVTEASRCIFIYHALTRLLLFLRKIKFIIYLGLCTFYCLWLRIQFFSFFIKLIPDLQFRSQLKWFPRVFLVLPPTEIATSHSW